MAKINQEEYEILKELDDKWKWITKSWATSLYAHDIEPWKNIMTLQWEGIGNSLRVKGANFHFISWKDDEPYNIAELIEEYEFEQELLTRRESILKGEPTVTFNPEGYESEETEVKDIEWLKEKLKEIKERNDHGNNHEGVATINLVLRLIDQLDVPEFTIYDAHDKIREESSLTDKSFDYYWNCIADAVEIDEPGNLLVPKQEEVDPDEARFNRKVNKIIKAIENPKRLKLRDVVEKMESLSEVNQKQWLDRLNEKFGEIEQEPKYYVINKENELLLSKNNEGDVITYSQDYAQAKRILSDLGHYQFTERKIKDYDPRYWAFRKPVEEVEE